MPTGNPPHKSSEDIISGEHRCEMIKLAIKDIPYFEKVVTYALDPFKMCHITSVIDTKGTVTATAINSFKYKRFIYNIHRYFTPTY